MCRNESRAMHGEVLQWSLTRVVTGICVPSKLCRKVTQIACRTVLALSSVGTGCATTIYSDQAELARQENKLGRRVCGNSTAIEKHLSTVLPLRLP
jgi:hypothetical protein